MKKIRVLVVDDSVLFRNLLVQSLSEDPYLEVVAQAGDAYAARDAILEYRPDVMTLDVEMPKMDGILFLRKLMAQFPLRVVVISALDARVFDAMEAGAVDFVCKPSTVERSKVSDFIRKELGTKIKIASTVRVGNLKRVESNPVRGVSAVNKDMVIAIGASTGGTEAIFEVVKQFRTDIPGVVIVQHMPPGFTEMYANRLNNQCQVAVKEAVTGDKVLPGRVLIAPGDKHMRLVKVNGVYQVECKAGEKVSGHCPSVDVLFSSVASIARDKAIGVILTGMGADGAAGLLRMRKNGAYTIGQDRESCVVYGMPMEAYKAGAVCTQASLLSIPSAVMAKLSKK